MVVLQNGQRQKSIMLKNNKSYDLSRNVLSFNGQNANLATFIFFISLNQEILYGVQPPCRLVQKYQNKILQKMLQKLPHGEYLE